MSELLNKSELNMEAARCLLKGGHHATVCHPAYYSCLQLMMYKINTSLGISYEQQGKDIACSKTNSHGYLIRKIKEQINRTEGYAGASRFDRKIKDLKKWREDSDYKNI